MIDSRTATTAGIQAVVGAGIDRSATLDPARYRRNGGLASISNVIGHAPFQEDAPRYSREPTKLARAARR